MLPVLPDMTVADLIVARLRAAGVRALFGVPGGGSNLDLIEAAQRIGVPFVLTATETAGAIAAIAQAEISSRPGACLTTLGPGVASVVNGVACARLDRAALVVLTDSHPAGGGDSFGHQRLDHYALLAPATKWSTAIAPDETAGIADLVDSAIACALAPPPGPVHLDVPADVGALSIAAGSFDARDAGDVKSAALRVGSWEAAESAIARARKPLLIVGLGARRPQDAAAIRSLSSRHALPAMVTYKAKGVVPDGDPHFAGVFTNAAIEQPIVDQADLLIGVGLDPVELLPRSWKYSQPIVYCGPWPVDARHVPFSAQLVTDVSAALDQLDAVLTESAWDLAAVGRSVAAQREALGARPTGLTADRVVRIAADAAAPVARVTVDAGAHMLPATMLWPIGEPNQMLISNGLSTMGFALPAAIGAALLDPDRAIVALTGDGGLLMCLGELLTAVRENVRIVTIVFNDRSLSLIDLKQRQRQYVSAGVTLGDVAWRSIAEGVGMPGHVATTERELDRALSQALAARGPSLIDARIDPSTYSDLLRAIRG
jgi:acetolactate synthase-1/2/3 large subunit